MPADRVFKAIVQWGVSEESPGNASSEYTMYVNAADHADVQRKIQDYFNKKHERTLEKSPKLTAQYLSIHSIERMNWTDVVID